MSAPSISMRMATGAAWMVALRFVIRGIGLASTIILARLLVPADFGLVAIATSIIGLLEAMSEFSFDMALIRHPNATRRHYDTAWTLSIMRASATAVLLVALAAPLAALFEEPRLTLVLLALAGVTFLTGFENVGVVQFRKELHFDREFKLLMTGRIASFVVTIGLALWFANYWALVAGIAAGRLVQLASGYLMHSYRPRLDLGAWRELISFSKWMLIGGILNFITTRLDTFIVGKFAGMQATGLYQVSYEISNLPATELVMPISRALFPGFSKLADDRHALNNAFLGSFAGIILMALPAVLGIALTADLIVTLFLGPKWVEAIPLIQILAIYGAIRVCFANTYAAFLALNRPDAGTWLLVPTLVVLVPSLLWATPRFGAEGAAWSLVAAAAVTFVLNIWWVMHLLGLRIGELVRVTWRPIVACVGMFLVVWGVRSILPDASFVAAGIEAVAVAAAGALAYSLLILATWWASGRPDGAEAKLIGLAARALPSRA